MPFVYFFDWMPYQRKESGYPIFQGLSLTCRPHCAMRILDKIANPFNKTYTR